MYHFGGKIQIFPHGEKVSFHNIASEASYVYILDKSSLKMHKNGQFGEFWQSEACGQTVLPDRSVLIGQKLVKNAKIQKFKCDIFSDFSNIFLGFFSTKMKMSS